MDNQFKPGDVVRLKSGGPSMTISSIGTTGSNPKAFCQWFEGTSPKSLSFRPETLEFAK